MQTRGSKKLAQNRKLLRDGDRNFPIGKHFTEAAGKTVRFLTFVDQGREWRALEIRFTDGTAFSIELWSEPQLRVQYLETRRGEIELLKDYGSFPC
jgi:hypothetical protein